MSFDLAFVVIFLVTVALAMRAGPWRAATALLVAFAAVAIGFFSGAQAGLLAFAVWAGVLAIFAIWKTSRAARGPVASSLAGVVQALLVTAFIPGLLLGGPYRDLPSAAQDLRQAVIYRPIHAVAGSLPLTDIALAYPAPLSPAQTTAKSAPRVIDWAAAVTFDGTAIRALPGEVRAAERAPLAFEVEGRIAQISVEIGDHFQAGDVLATLNTHILELALQEREAALIEADARLDEARQTLERQEALFRRGVVAESVYESGVAALDSALSRQRVAQSAIEQAQDRLEDATLRAPYAGSVAVRLAEPAQTVRAGEPVLEIQSNSGGFEISATVPDTLVSRLELGSKHDVTILDGSLVTAHATLTEIGARSTGSSGFPVSLSLTDIDSRLRAGMSVELALRLTAGDHPAGIVAIPLKAVLMAQDQARHVFVFDHTGSTLDRRPITLAGTEGDRALVSDGLAPGDIVATRGIPFLTDGMAVTLRGTGIARYDE